MPYSWLNTWILHGSEAFICKALKGEVVVCYFEPLITQQMKASGSPDVLGRSSKSEAQRVKINEIKSVIIFFTDWVFCFVSKKMLFYSLPLLASRSVGASQRQRIRKNISASFASLLAQ